MRVGLSDFADREVTMLPFPYAKNVLFASA